MELFINECSFEEQFYEQKDFEAALPALLRLIERGRQATSDGRGKIWRSQDLEQACARPRQPLKVSVNHIRDQELREQFRVIVWDRANPEPWQPSRQHLPTDDYHWEAQPTIPEAIADTSMAELAERRLREPQRPGCLLNLSRSRLDATWVVTVIKNRCESAVMASATSAPELDRWLASLGQEPYGPSSPDPPRDDQTCLTKGKYAPLTLFQQGRRCYQDRTKGHYYYVDNLHMGAAAHLEVFDKRGQHLGEADLNGKLRQSTADGKKTLPL